MALIDVIKFDGFNEPWLIYKFPSENLVLGSQLIVNNSQEAIFFKGGLAYDVFGSGTHTLSSSNIPLLQKIINIPFGGKTPFSAEIYFINKIVKLDMKYGTTDPFQVTDPKYGIIVKVRSFGQFGIKISDSRNFITQIIGSLQQGTLTNYETIKKYFKGLVITKLKDTIGNLIINGKVSVLDISAQLDSISTICKEKIESEFDRFGIEVLNFFIESINIPEEDLSRIKKILEDKAEFNILGDAQYTKKRTFDVLENASSNEGNVGNLMGAGMGLGIGFGMGGQMPNIVSQMNTSQIKIKCFKCGFENVDGTKYCGNCGEKILTEKIICPKCKSENQPGIKFCGNCGTSLQPKKCEKCNYENDIGIKFCGNCGNKIEE